MAKKNHGKTETEKLAKFKAQEEFIVKSLGLKRQDLEARTLSAQLLAEIDEALFAEPVLLFAHADSDEKIDPTSLAPIIEDLIFDCALIHEMAINCNPALTSDKIDAFLSEAEKLINFGDYDLKREYMLLLKNIVRTKEAKNMAALSDLFLVEIPEVLNSLLDQMAGRHVKRKDIFRQRVSKNPKPMY